MISSEEIRLGRFSEARRIAELSRSLIEYGLGWSWTPERVVREMRSKSSNVIVVADGSKISGFAIMSYGDEEARLNLFAVDPKHRRRGVGTRLIRWLEKTALVSGCGVIYLEARSNNEDAIKFYKSVGYRIVQRIPRYYGNREMAVRMAHDLWSAQSE